MSYEYKGTTFRSSMLSDRLELFECEMLSGFDRLSLAFLPEVVGSVVISSFLSWTPRDIIYPTSNRLSHP